MLGRTWCRNLLFEEEDDGPDTAAGHLEDNLWVGDEDEAGAAVHHVLHRHPLVVGHVPEDAEGDDPGQEAGAGVHKAGDDGVLINDQSLTLLAT